MTKERNVIESNLAVVFEGDIYSSLLKSILINFEGDVVVHGDFKINNDFHVKGNLYVTGNTYCVGDYKIDIEGDFYCQGDISCYEISVDGSIYCYKIDSDDLKVSENLLCKEIIAMYSKIIVAGDIECERIRADDIYVLGKIRVENAICSDRIEVGY